MPGLRAELTGALLLSGDKRFLSCLFVRAYLLLNRHVEDALGK